MANYSDAARKLKTLKRLATKSVEGTRSTAGLRDRLVRAVRSAAKAFKVSTEAFDAQARLYIFFQGGMGNHSKQADALQKVHIVLEDLFEDRKTRKRAFGAVLCAFSSRREASDSSSKDAPRGTSVNAFEAQANLYDLLTAGRDEDLVALSLDLDSIDRPLRAVFGDDPIVQSAVGAVLYGSSAQKAARK